MKRTFEIEWEDDNGPFWMNRDNLLICLTEHCRNSVFTVRDVTGDGECDTAPETSGPRDHALTEKELHDTREISVERYGTGYLLADYSGNRGEASYCGISMAWSRTPIVRDPFPTKEDAIKAGYDSSVT